MGIPIDQFEKMKQRTQNAILKRKHGSWITPESKPMSKHKPKSYNPAIVTAFFAEQGIPMPEFEYKFCPTRKWRFDLAWPPVKCLAVEVDGGIWIQGGHNRGAQIKKTWEKENEANIIGWCILKCEPKDLCTTEFAQTIKRALGL